MNLLKYFLFLPIVFSAFNVNLNKEINEPKVQEKTANDIAAYAPASDDELISTDLQLEPYKTDNFTTIFQYHGIKPVKCWSKEDGLYVKLNDKFLREKNEVEAEIYCYKPKGMLTFYVENEKEETSELSIFTRLTKHGVFACVNSEAACENMVLSYEYENGYIPKETLDHHVSYGEDFGDYWYPDMAKPFRTVVQGQLTYEDCNGNKHPAPGVCIILSGTAYKTYTNFDGSFSFDISTSNLIFQEYWILVYASSEWSFVSPFRLEDSVSLWQNGPIYNKDFNFQLKKGFINTVDICVKYSDPFNKPIQIISCLYYGGEYVKMVGQRDPSRVHVVYPWGISGHINSFSAFWLMGLNAEHFEVWDVILHEYGHTIEAQLGVFACIPYYHSYYVDYTGNDLVGIGSFKGLALQLAYQEALATVFGNIITQTFSDRLINVPNVGDTYYDETATCVHDDRWNLEGLDGSYARVGDANEQTTQRFLYDLWDIGTDEDEDNVNLGNANFWNLIKNSQAFTITQLVEYIYDNNLIEKESLNVLLEFYHFAPSDVQLFANSSLKRLSWNKTGNVNNVHTDGNRTSRNVGDLYLVQFYSSNDILLFERTTTDNKYDITNSEWQTLLNQSDSFYKVRIGAKSTQGGFTTGYYFGKTYSFPFPVNGSETFDISSLDGSIFGTNQVGERSFPVGNFIRKVSWQSVTRITNNKNNQFLCLNAGASSSHTSYIGFRASSEFRSVSFDLVFKTNSSSLSNAAIEIYKYEGRSTIKVADINPSDVGAGINNETRRFTVSMGENVKGFQLRVTGSGNTALCVRNISFELSES